MLIFIISLVVFAIGICLACIDCKYDILNGFWVSFTAVCLIIGGVAFFICSSLSCITLCTKNIGYEQAIYEKEMLEYRIEHQQDNLIGGELLYSDILNFNNEIKRCKKFSKNPFVNWYFNDKLAEIEYIDYRKG